MHGKKKKAVKLPPFLRATLLNQIGVLLHILRNLIYRYDSLLEDVSTCLLRLNHLDTLGKLLTYTSTKGCNCFLCHNSTKLFNFTVYCYLLQVWIVLLALETLWGVLLVLGGDVT